MCFIADNYQAFDQACFRYILNAIGEKYEYDIKVAVLIKV